MRMHFLQNWNETMAPMKVGNTELPANSLVLQTREVPADADHPLAGYAAYNLYRVKWSAVDHICLGDKRNERVPPHMSSNGKPLDRPLTKQQVLEKVHSRSAPLLIPVARSFTMVSPSKTALRMSDHTEPKYCSQDRQSFQSLRYYGLNFVCLCMPETV